MKKFKIEDFPNIGAVMASAMLFEDHMKPHFIFREKPSNDNDSGWRIFSGFESDEYSDNADNFGFYDAKTILKVDNSISQLLLYKGYGSVWEKKENADWEEVFDYPLEDDYEVKHQLSKNWGMTINNLFEKNANNKDLMFTTGDKTIRLAIWNHDGKTKSEILENQKEDINARNEVNTILKRYEFHQDSVNKIGYHIKEYDEQKDLTYNLLCTFNSIDNEVLQSFFYFDDETDLDWALDTWKSIEVKNN